MNYFNRNILENYKKYDDSERSEKIFVQLEKQLSEASDEKKNVIKQVAQNTGYLYPEDKFQVMLCNSLENGSEAIMLGGGLDVFQVPRNQDTTYKENLICHEIGMYLFNQNLFSEYCKAMIADARFYF